MALVNLLRHRLGIFVFATFCSLSTAVGAGTLDFDFSFSSGTSTLQGTLFGATDNATGPIDRVVVDLVGTPDVGLEFLPSDPANLAVIVTDGRVTGTSILESALIGPDNFLLQIFVSEVASAIFRTNVKLLVTRGADPVGTRTEIFSTVFDTEPYAPFDRVNAAVPLPGALPMTLSVMLGTFVGLRRRKSRTP